MEAFWDFVVWALFPAFVVGAVVGVVIDWRRSGPGEEGLSPAGRLIRAAVTGATTGALTIMVFFMASFAVASVIAIGRELLD